MVGHDLIVISTANSQQIPCFRAKSDLFAEVRGENCSQLYHIVQPGRLHFSKALGRWDGRVVHRLRRISWEAHGKTLEWLQIVLVPNLIQKFRIESDPFPFYKPAWTLTLSFPERLGHLWGAELPVDDERGEGWLGRGLFVPFFILLPLWSLYARTPVLFYGGHMVFPPEAPEPFTITVPMRSSNICF